MFRFTLAPRGKRTELEVAPLARRIILHLGEFQIVGGDDAANRQLGDGFEEFSGTVQLDFSCVV